MRQMFNIREGIDPAANRINNNRLVGSPPLPDGPTSGNTFDLEGQIRKYWEKIGWNPDNGVPLPETLEKLAISEYVGGAE